MASLINWAKLRKLALLNTYKLDAFSPVYWDKHATSFNDNVSYMDELTESQLSKLHLLPEYTVLDIGAGSGRLTIPLAKRVKHVTAVEPSTGMLSLLQANAMKENVTNILHLGSSWEKLNLDDVGIHDVVIASFSLFMLDIEDELRKMNSATAKYVYLFLPASKWIDDEIQKIISNTTFPSGLDYIYVYNVLHDLDIFANVEIWSYEVAQGYKNIDDAVAKFTELYNILSDTKDELRGHLQKILVKDKGKLWLRRKRKVAMIWWAKNK